MKRKLFSISIILIIWQITSLIVSREVILPYPVEVFKTMISLLSKPLFYKCVMATLGRVAMSIVLSSLGILLGILAGKYKVIDELITPVMEILQTIPQIAFILILVVWLKSYQALLAIILFMTFPIFYHNAKNGISHISEELTSLTKIYPHSWLYNLVKVELPLIKTEIIAACDLAIPMAFKVGVMAEVFVSSQLGIGYALYLARVNIDMTLIFAWVIWLIVILKLILFIYHKLVRI